MNISKDSQTKSSDEVMWNVLINTDVTWLQFYTNSRAIILLLCWLITSFSEMVALLEYNTTL